jgi:hypothetical protein
MVKLVPYTDEAGNVGHVDLDRYALAAHTHDGTPPVEPPDPEPGTITPSEFFQRFRRGINMNGIELNWAVTKGNRWGKAELQEVKRFGFDHIRLPANAHAWWREQGKMHDLDQRIDWALDVGLGVMLDPVHHHDGLSSNPDGNIEEFKALWRHIAERYKSLAQDWCCFDLANEMKIKDSGKLAWVYRQGLAAVREVSPERICGYGDTWDGVWVPDRIQHPDDDFVFLKAHIYLTDYDHEVKVPWPYNDGQVSQTQRIGTWESRIKAFAEMAAAKGKPVHAGEFGFKRAAKPDKAAFIRWHRQQYQRYGWSSAYWTYYAEPFGARTLDYQSWEPWAQELVK